MLKSKTAKKIPAKINFKIITIEYHHFITTNEIQ